MSETKLTPAARGSRKREGKSARNSFKHGFYTSLFTPDEVRHLDAGAASIRDEMNLLRTKILRLARLTPLKKIDAKELEALIKLIRVVAMLDALERTGIMRSKLEASASPLLDVLADMDPDDL